MKFHLTKNKKKRTILMLGIFSIVFNSLAPYFQTAVASTANGYSETICSSYGLKTVFISFETEQQQKPSDCFECPPCIVQANAGDWIEADVTFTEPRFVRHQPGQAEPLYWASLSEPHFFRFLSRAPPL